MRLEKMSGGHKRRPPLRTVSEIAESLGIATTRLMWALKAEGAPQPVLRADQVGHTVTGNNKVWYEPKAVIAWYRAYEAANPEAAKRRQYFREYAQRRKAGQGKEASNG